MSKDILRDLRGFGTVEKWVLTDPKINIHAKAIYALLCAYAGGKDSAFPSVDTLVYQLNISKDTIYKYIKELRKKGVIDVEQVRDGGRFSRNIYTLLNYNPNMISTESGSIGHGTAVADTSVSDQVDTNNNSLKNNSSKSNSNTNTDSSTDDRSPYSEKFEQWWALYPRKTGKGAAWKKWKSEKLEKRFEELIEKLKQQIAMDHTFANKTYIVGASRYLNEARYDDEIEQRGSANETNFTSNQQVDRTTARNRKLQEEWNRLQNNEERDGDVIPDLEVHGRQLRPSLDD